MSLAIYRKYRPKTLNDLIGQDLPVKVIKNAAKNDKLAHAYLFYGSRGSGKTTAARILAKILNCETRKKDEKFREKGEPCNKCRPCIEIDENKAIDVVEIDAASNRGIDEIRNIKEGIRLSPTSYNFKVFIIDEVHQLTKAASDALLKTLEEPPAHAVFILATTEFDKIPETISSRTQRLHFNRIPVSKIAEKLKKIVKEEKIKIEDDAVELIASSADGSLRDAESLLEQVVAMEEFATLESIERILGKVGLIRITTLAEKILENNLQETLEYISEIQNKGFNIVELNKDLIHYLRRVITLKIDPAFEKIYQDEVTNEEFKKIKEHSAKISIEKHIPLLKSLIRAYSEMRYSPFAIVPFEVAIIENLEH